MGAVSNFQGARGGSPVRQAQVQGLAAHALVRRSLDMESGERVAAMPESSTGQLTSCVHRQADFDDLDEMLVYPGSAPATNLDNNLWLPDIVTYAGATSSSSHLHARCMHAACCMQPRCMRWAGTTRRNWSE